MFQVYCNELKSKDGCKLKAFVLTLTRPNQPTRSFVFLPTYSEAPVRDMVLKGYATLELGCENEICDCSERGKLHSSVLSHDAKLDAEVRLQMRAC